MEDDSNPEWFRTAALGLVYLVGVRFALVYGTGLECIAHDTGRYFARARALFDGDFAAYFPNGLSTVIAGIWSVVGREVLAPLVWLNVLCSVGVAIGVFCLARDWFEGSERGAGLVVALVACLSIAHWPNHLRFVPRVLTDIPATFLVAAGLWALVSRRGVLAGLSLGVAATFRPSLLPIWIGGVGLMLVRRDGRPAGVWRPGSCRWGTDSFRWARCRSAGT